MVFQIVMYDCESWTIKKNWCLQAVVLKKTRERVPWTARRTNQSILKEINPEYSLEKLMLKLKLQYFGHLMWTAYSLKKTLILGKIEDRKRRGWQRMRDGWMASSAQWTCTWAHSGRIKFWTKPHVCKMFGRTYSVNNGRSLTHSGIKRSLVLRSWHCLEHR